MLERDLLQGLCVKNHQVIKVEGQSSNWEDVFQKHIDIGKFVLDIGHLCPVITMKLEKGAPMLLMS